MVFRTKCKAVRLLRTTVQLLTDHIVNFLKIWLKYPVNGHRPKRVLFPGNVSTIHKHAVEAQTWVDALESLVLVA